MLFTNEKINKKFVSLLSFKAKLISELDNIHLNKKSTVKTIKNRLKIKNTAREKRIISYKIKKLKIKIFELILSQLKNKVDGCRK